MQKYLTTANTVNAAKPRAGSCGGLPTHAGHDRCPSPKKCLRLHNKQHTARSTIHQCITQLTLQNMNKKTLKLATSVSQHATQYAPQKHCITKSVAHIIVLHLLRLRRVTQKQYATRHSCNFPWSMKRKTTLVKENVQKNSLFQHHITRSTYQPSQTCSMEINSPKLSRS